MWLSHLKYGLTSDTWYYSSASARVRNNISQVRECAGPMLAFGHVAQVFMIARFSIATV
jgi:hypothetical protein